MSFAGIASAGYVTDFVRVLLVSPTAYTNSTAVGLIAAIDAGSAEIVTLRPSMSVTVAGYVVPAAAVGEAPAAVVGADVAVPSVPLSSSPPHAAAAMRLAAAAIASAAFQYRCIVPPTPPRREQGRAQAPARGCFCIEGIPARPSRVVDIRPEPPQT